jgi:hypothetical protein
MFLIFFVRFDHVKHLGAGLDVSFGASRCFLVIGCGSFNEKFMQTVMIFLFLKPRGFRGYPNQLRVRPLG